MNSRRQRKLGAVSQIVLMNNHVFSTGKESDQGDNIISWYLKITCMGNQSEEVKIEIKEHWDRSRRDC
jgi:hypothetical protein